jgi:NADPH:quinone reductase-like Zn-dependent oxidoreductase
LKCISVLKEGGIYVSVNIDFPFSDRVMAALAKKNAKGKVVGENGAYPYSALNKIAQLIDDGKVKVIISKIYPLEQVAEAHKESETFHVRGKLVVEVRKENDDENDNDEHENLQG